VSEETEKLCITKGLIATPYGVKVKLRTALEDASFNAIQITEETKKFFISYS